MGNRITVLPYKIIKILTDTGIQFTNGNGDKYAFMHTSDRICYENNIEHRLTKINHPWTNGPVERMNRTLKEASVKRYHYDNHHRLKQPMHAFVNAYNFAKMLKTLKSLTPDDFIIKTWQSEPERFNTNPNHYTWELIT